MDYQFDLVGKIGSMALIRKEDKDTNNLTIIAMNTFHQCITDFFQCYDL